MSDPIEVTITVDTTRFDRMLAAYRREIESMRKLRTALAGTEPDDGERRHDDHLARCQTCREELQASEPAPACEQCGGSGTVQCWSPGGPCSDDDKAKGCECCGPCRECGRTELDGCKRAVAAELTRLGQEQAEPPWHKYDGHNICERCGQAAYNDGADQPCPQADPPVERDDLVECHSEGYAEWRATLEQAAPPCPFPMGAKVRRSNGKWPTEVGIVSGWEEVNYTPPEWRVWVTWDQRGKRLHCTPSYLELVPDPPAASTDEPPADCADEYEYMRGFLRGREAAARDVAALFRERGWGKTAIEGATAARGERSE